jgi:ribosomal protein L16 Arg81 hydroxylase
MNDYSIADIVGDIEGFKRDYFNKKPMFRRNALPAISQDVLSLADLDDLINLEIVRYPYIKVNLNGSGVPEFGYTKDITVQGSTVTGVPDPEKVHALYRAGGTITWASLNQICPKVREFIRMISQAMAVRTDAVAFLTPAGKKGYPAHHDGVDLFIVQVSGSKHWRLWNLAKERGEGETYTREETLGEPVIEETLKAGDVLYLPYGTPHQATAQDEPSLHLSIMMRPRMWRDLLKESVDRVLADSEFLDYPMLSSDFSGETHREFERNMDALVARLSTTDLESEWETLRATGRSQPGVSTSRVFATSAAAASIDAGTSLRMTTRQFSSQELADGRVQLEVTGLKFAVSASLAGKIQNMAPGDLATAAELMSDIPRERQQMVAKALVRMDLFAVTS